VHVFDEIIDSLKYTLKDYNVAHKDEFDEDREDGEHEDYLVEDGDC
jgi:hypothetical protein